MTIVVENEPRVQVTLEQSPRPGTWEIGGLPVIPHDAEWQGNTPACISFGYQGRPHLIINQDVVKNPDVYKVAKTYSEVWPMSFGDSEKPLLEVLERLTEGRVKKLHLMHFYSPKDLEYAVSWEVMKDHYTRKEITQKRCMRGKVSVGDISANVIDLKGLGVGSLEKIAASKGLNTDWKQPEGVEPLDKSCMIDEMNNRPEVFFRYAVDDAMILPQLFEATLKNLNGVMDSVGISPVFHYTPENLPMTTGAQTAGIIERYIKNYVPYGSKYHEVWLFCHLLNGVLEDPNNLSGFAKKNAKVARQAMKELKALIQKGVEKSPESSPLDIAANVLKRHTVRVGRKEKRAFEVVSNQRNWQFLGYAQSGVKWYGSYIHTTAKYNALVLGGRCQRERPEQYLFRDVVDADFKSAYATLLRASKFPVGLPTTIGYSNNDDDRVTWGEFRRKVLPGLTENWSVVLDGKFGSGLRQDLIHSKKVSGKDILKAILGEWEKENTEGDSRDDVSHIPGDFLLLKDQLVNGVLTPELWGVGSAVMSDREKREFDKLRVKTATYYQKSDLTSDVNEWMTEVLKDRGSFSADKKTGQPKDTRTRKNFQIDFEGLFGVTTDVRNQAKADMKTAKRNGEPHEVVANLNAKQEALKLFNNCGYGVLAAPFFPIGNTVLANRITSGIRVAAWMLVKGVDGIGSITDGSAYEVNAVRYLKPCADGKKPSLSAMAYRSKLDSHRAIKREPLGGLDWSKLLSDAESSCEVPGVAQDYNLSPEKQASYGTSKASDLDMLLTDHLRGFWSHYGLTPQFMIEHKPENTSRLWACLGKADYAMQTTQGKRYYKVRGAKLWREPELRPSPKFKTLDNILDGVDTYPEDLQYDASTLLSVSMWQHANVTHKGFESIGDTRPGDRITQIRNLRMNNTYAPLNVRRNKPVEDELATFVTRQNRGQKTAPMFERHASEGIRKVELRMLRDIL